MFHSAEWDHTYDWRNKRIAVVGNGSTGAQLMPRVPEGAASLTVFQRNPQWIAPINDYRHAVPREVHWLMNNMPYYWSRFSGFKAMIGYQEMQVLDRERRDAGGTISRRNDAFRDFLQHYIKDQLGDRSDLVEQVTPTFAPLVRRLVVDNGWYKALLRDNVHLVVDPISHITSSGISTRDGSHYDLDLIVLATGFKVSQYLWPVQYLGRNGATLESLWAADGARAYLRTVVPGLPNFFILYGPNSQARGGGSLYSWAECWARYAAKAIVALIETDRRRDVRPEAFTQFNERLDRKSSDLIWTMPGHSYYVNAHGREGVNMPLDIAEYYRLLEQPNFAHFDFG
jgi:4-hydroxyacetophenone monooxygenase